MYKRFAFEGPIHESLECVPLTVRRKLDLAGLKISLAGWQALTRAERLALCHLPVDDVDEVAVYRDVLEGFASRAGTALTPLAPAPDARPWNAPDPPAPVADRLAALGLAVAPAQWTALDEESRYALYKLADPKREPEKLVAAMSELGLASSAPGGPLPCARR